VNAIARTIRRVFPPPRGPLAWTDPLPLVVFLLLYGLAILLLEWQDVLTFTRPWQFLWMTVSVWVWWMALNGWSGLSRRRALQALIVRLLLVGTFVALMAEPRAVRTSDKLAVVYAVDISESVHPDQVAEALKFVAQTVAEKPQGDEAGLIVFGGSAAVELPPRPAFPIDENAPEGSIHLTARVNRDATNIEQTLSLGAAVLPEETRGRIVLITDGTETVGDLKSALGQLQSREIAVDVLPITYSYENEVWVERLELPQTVKIGESYAASVVISSLNDGKGKLVLEENGEPVRDEPFDVEFKEGKNRIDVPIFLREPGYYEYKATLIPEEGTDSRSENNHAMGYVYVEGEGKVLVVVDPLRNDDRDFERLTQAIHEGERAVEVVESYDFARDPLSLLPYDAVVFANVPHDAFDAVQLQALRDAVFNQGIGFLMVGGEHSFGPGGYHRTVVEEALPVTMDITKKKILPKGALVIVLHTCEFPEGNAWAKRITKQAIKVLGSQDEVGCIAYTIGGENWIFEMTPAGEYESLVPKINSAAIGDMPAFGPPMQMGLKALQESDAATKHMIIISDGDPQPASQAIMQGYIDSKISVSTVAIFPHGGIEIGLLRTVANVTGGRYYFPADPNELPSIFIKEAKTLKRSMIQEQEIFPQAGFPSTVLEGIDAMPSLHGFVLTTLKEGALTENVLYTIPEDAEEGETDPVLAVWRYGLGTTAAFTSSLSNQWARDWVTWEQYRAFVKQLMMRISRVRKAGHMRMWTYHAGGEGIVMVEDFHPEEMFLDVVARVNGPGNFEEVIPLRQVGPRRYQGTFPANEKGRFQVTAIGKSGEREDRVHAGFIISYSPEYLKFTSDWNALREIKEATGGEELSVASTAAEIYNRRLPKQSTQPIFDWFLIALACLLPLDVAIRRVQLDWSAIRQALGLGKRADSTKTMGTLLAKKHQVSSQLKGRREERPFVPTGASAGTTRPPGRRTAAKPSTTTATATQAPPREDTTTSRLLEMKRRRQQDGDEQ
jgi:uncharacterized membrane protein